MQRAVNISFFEQKGLNNIKTERGEKIFLQTEL